jgi:hypothetical protein
MPITIAALESYPTLIFYMTGRVFYRDIKDAIDLMQNHVKNRKLQSLYTITHMHDFEISAEDLQRGNDYAAQTTLSNYITYLLTPMAVGNSEKTDETLKEVRQTTGTSLVQMPTIEDANEFAPFLHDLRGGKR